jgi:hypothetical protein
MYFVDSLFVVKGSFDFWEKFRKVQSSDFLDDVAFFVVFGFLNKLDDRLRSFILLEWVPGDYEN